MSTSGRSEARQFRARLSHPIIDGLINEVDFRGFMFVNAVRFWGEVNPDFFKGTAAAEVLANGYPGAPHSFFDRKYEEFKDASADAWTHVQRFVRSNTK